VNHLLSDTTRIMTCEPQLPVCFNIHDLHTSPHSVRYTYVCAHIWRLIRNHEESTLIVFDLERIDLCTLHVPDTSTSIPISLPLVDLIRNVATSTLLPSSLVQCSIRDWCRPKTGTMQNTTLLPSMDTRASVIDSLPPPYMVCRCDLNPHSQRPVARRITHDHPRAFIDDGFFLRPTRWSDPGPHSRRLAAYSAIYDYMASLRA
jgi:hypothetical protein